VKELVGSLVSIHTGDNEDFSKQARASATLELEGFVGVVDIPGSIEVGDRIIVEVYEPPSS
jgi:hypothetical protein